MKSFTKQMKKSDFWTKMLIGYKNEKNINFGFEIYFLLSNKLHNNLLMQDWVSRLRLKLNNLSPDHASVIIQKQDYPLKKLLWKHDLTLKARHEDFEVPSLKY